MKPFAGKKVTVAGLGTHGGAVGNIRWLAQQGARLTVTDLKSAEELRDSVADLQDIPDITWRLGKHDLADFTETDMVVRNPAMPRRSPYLEAARAAKVTIEMDSSLFFKYSPTNNIVGVTGSKGKTTTTLAISHLLQLVYPKVVTVGVESTSPLAALGQLTPRDVAVFELSSWRIEGLQEHQLSPHTAVITSLYRDHLDTYDSFEEYVATKKALLANQTRQDRVFLNYDDPLLRTWGPTLLSNVKWYSIKDHIPGDGVFVNKQGIIMVTQNNTNTMASLFPASHLPLSSDHQRRNVLPAIYLAFCNNIRVEDIERHVVTMQKPAHRLEAVREVRGVYYVNDSASTIPDSTIAALEAFRDKHLVLIAGGSDKKLRFSSLAKRLPEFRVRAIIFLPGNATADLRREIEGAFDSPPPIVLASTMVEAVQLATEHALAGDTVLLSPGATSFGLFKHEFDRGEQFRKAVESLY